MRHHTAGFDQLLKPIDHNRNANSMHKLSLQDYLKQQDERSNVQSAENTSDTPSVYGITQQAYNSRQRSTKTLNQ